MKNLRHVKVIPDERFTGTFNYSKIKVTKKKEGGGG